MINFDVIEGEGKLIVHMAGDDTNYEVTYEYGYLVFTKEDRQYRIPETNADDLYFHRKNPNTEQRKFDFINYRNLYRDTTPTDFGISDLVDVMPGSSHFTDEIVLGGVNDKVPVIAPSGVVIFVNGHAVPSGTLVDNHDVIKFEITATSEVDTTENIVMNIGDISKSFNITTTIPFTNFTFTNAGANGYAGPTLTQMTSAYSSEVWFDQYFSSNVQGVQTLTIPHTGTYRITAAGAQGGYQTYYNSQGGKGAILRLDVVLEAGTDLNLVVGQAGAWGGISGEGTGGGGGSFVYTGTIGGSGLILAAGGGGGADDSTVGGCDAVVSLNPTYNFNTGEYPNNGQDGVYNGGHVAYGCGAGWLNDYQSRVGLETSYGTNGFSKSSGYRGSPVFEGGTYYATNYANNSFGGFGGGGANYDDGGAGGGFSGGMTTSTAGGGAGGSFYAGMSNSYYTSIWAGAASNYTWLGNNGATNTQNHGYITIEFLG